MPVAELIREPFNVRTRRDRQRAVRDQFRPVFGLVLQVGPDQLLQVFGLRQTPLRPRLGVPPPASHRHLYMPAVQCARGGRRGRSGGVPNLCPGRRQFRGNVSKERSEGLTSADVVGSGPVSPPTINRSQSGCRISGPAVKRGMAMLRRLRGSRLVGVPSRPGPPVPSGFQRAAPAP